MRAVVLERFGTPYVLEFRELPDPVPPAGGYVVRIIASAVNYADVVERRGLYKRDQHLPCALGKEAAGVVVARDPDAVEFEVGDPVIVVRFGNGCYADLVAAAPNEVLRPPRGLSFLEMAAFGTAYATAWYAMHEIARVRPGDSALIQAAAGGVGNAAIVLARTGGCSLVIGTAGGSVKCAVVLRHGADVCVDYLAGDLREGVLAATGGAGVDYCLESVGGDTYRKSLDVMGPMGHLVVIGFSGIADDYAAATPRLHPLTVFQRSFSVGGLNMDNLGFTGRREVWAHLVAHAEEHAIVPEVNAVFPFAEIRSAHQALESRKTTGKVVLVLDESATSVPGGRTAAVPAAVRPTVTV
jgi:NADPH2:quinone reductase